MGRDLPRLKRLGSVKVYVVTDPFTDRSGQSIAAGQVVIFRRNAGRPNVYAGVYDALRSRLEIKIRYGLKERRGELNELETALERLRHVRLCLASHDVLSTADDRRIEGGLGEVAELLKRKSNPFKAEARIKAKAGAVRTPTEKVNAPATQARVTAIDRRLRERQREVASILPWITAMETALFLEIERSLGVIGRVGREAGAMMCHRFCRTGRAAPQQLRLMAARLGLLQEELATLEAAPFDACRVALAGAVGRAKRGLETGNALVTVIGLGEALAAVDRAVLRHGLESLISFSAAALISGLPTRAAEALLRRLATVRSRFGRNRQAKALKLVEADLAGCAQALGRGDLAAAKEALKQASARL